MLKVRYYRVRLSKNAPRLPDVVERAAKQDPNLKIIHVGRGETVFTYSVLRSVVIRRRLEDGSEEIDSISTLDIHNVRCFYAGSMDCLSIVDPPRGGRVIAQILDSLAGDGNYFFEPLEISAALIARHIKSFDSAKMVSARIRDFEAYPGAVGRLEISSQDGLEPGIAPFVSGKFYRLESMTYAVTKNYTHGLVYYHSNGTLKVTGPMVDTAFPSFEASFAAEVR